MASDANVLIRLVKVRQGGEMLSLRFPKVNNAATPLPIHLLRSPSGLLVVTKAPGSVKEKNTTKVRDALRRDDVAVRPASGGAGNLAFEVAAPPGEVIAFLRAKMGDGGLASTANVHWMGVGSTLPARSTARTRRSCVPPETPSSTSVDRS